MQFLSTNKNPPPKGKRVDALNTVRIWMRGRPPPRDLRLALLYLLPELKTNEADDFEHHATSED